MVFVAVIIIIMATTATISISVCSQIGMMVASINPPLDPPFGQPDQYVTPQHHHQYHHHHHQDHHHIITNLPIRVKERPRSCCMRRCARLSVPLKVQIFSEQRRVHRLGHQVHAAHLVDDKDDVDDDDSDNDDQESDD